MKEMVLCKKNTVPYKTHELFLEKNYFYIQFSK